MSTSGGWPLIKQLREWQRLENHAMTSCSKVLEKTTHPVLRFVMETILTDSRRHYHVLQHVLADLESPGEIPAEEVRAVELEMKRHHELEERTVQDAEELLEVVKQGDARIATFLLEFMLDDENKHRKMIERLEDLTKGDGDPDPGEKDREA